MLAGPRSCCSPPGTSVNDVDTTTTATTVKVTPPALGGAYDNYKLSVCPVGGQAADCKTFNCAPANIAACPVTGLAPNTE